MDILKKDSAYVWHPFTQAKTATSPIPVVKAEGVWLFDETGKKYLDLNSSWWTNIHGHCHPYMVEKISEQLAKLDHVIFAGVTHPKAVEVAERIVNLLPDQFSKVFFSDNGSTSVEVAIKMVYQRWFNKGVVKKRFLAIDGAYHGDTFGAMSVGQRGYFNEPFEHLFFEVDYIPFPEASNIDEVYKRTEELFKTGEFAGFIFEPLVQGAAGMRMYRAEWLDGLLELAGKYEVISIADEVMTGFFRTGQLFAINYLTNVPDIICLSKGVSGGVLPIGLTAATSEIYEAFLSDDTRKALLHGHSFTANPISCAAVCASLDLLQKKETVDQVKMISEAHAQFVEQNKGNPLFKSVSSLGTILSMEIGEKGSYFSTSNISDDAHPFFLEHGMLIRSLGNILFVNPPYCIAKAELDSTYGTILEFLETHFSK